MRRKRNTRALFWPALAAVAIILTLLGVTHLERWTGVADDHFTSRDQRSQSGQLDRDSANAVLLPPRTLIASDKKSRAVNPDLATPNDSRDVNRHSNWTHELDVISLLEPPTVQQPTVVLMAPVVDDEEELAGFRPGNSESFFSSNAALVSDRNDIRDPFNAADRSEGVQLQQRRSDHAPVYDETDDSMLSGEQVELDTEIQRQPKQDRELENSADDSKYGGLESKPSGIAWPRTPALEADLSQLQNEVSGLSDTRVKVWTTQVRQSLLELQNMPSINDKRAGAVIAHLRQLADRGIEIGESFASQRRLQQQVLRTAHSVLRRSVVWNAVWTVGESSTGWVVSDRAYDGQSLLPTIHAARALIDRTGDAQGWTRYLLLDEIERAVDTPDAETRKLLAQRLLSRVQWERLNESHRQFLQDPELSLLAMRIRPWADTPVDYASLLHQLERQESDALDLGAIEVATAVQTLRFSDNQQAANVAREVNNYYRNANLRLAVSADLLNQLLPEVPTKTTPIQHTIIGLPVRGTGVVSSELGLRLIPTSGSWNIALQTNGNIASVTGSRQWPVRVTNRGSSHFVTTTPIQIDTSGIRVGDTHVDVSSKVRLQGMKTDFDGFPVVESLVRALAMSRYEESAPAARRESEGIARNEINQQVSGEIDTQINKASDQLAGRLLGPLGRLELDPLVVDLDTTETRLMARYRIAGDWQLAAFTPRPRALANSVLSLQLHQSLLNNTFEQLLPSDSPQPIRGVLARIFEIFGAGSPTLPEELPEDVKIQFASTRPVTVEIEDGLLWLTLRVVWLHDDRSLDLRHFVVRAAFRPEFDGLNASLVREGVLSIYGPRMGIRERVPVRAIFTKVLDSDRPLPLISEELLQHPAAEQLQVGMLELVDGWLCLAICPRTQPQIADQHSLRANRK